ncbi:accessory Sec system protein translocase subunit SecY2 [Leuconostoc holzapfelii]|uniref:Accessory Sec system protein translocase subunit SecY2 n=1 Tax=Leuconostoc holzapfelii TaxID=434464 RepID=A0A846Z7J0_9LACO|nr:accessory Sec system protein translocase subunit SecY2 [Leuconostoc holzapfelii]NKZ17647.1 accessory Sec system protein translocase subunit SecY2 [Leuconostoc holzapfelii]
MRLRRDTKVIGKKGLWTILVLVVFVTGRHILVPGVNVDQVLKFSNNQYMLQFVSGTTGGDLSTLSLFSLGLAPWMSALIIWRVLQLFKRLELDKITTTRAYVLKMLLALLLAVIQSLSIAFTISLDQSGKVTGFSGVYEALEVAFIMVAGSVLLIWLSNMNDIYGLGGPSVLILAGMLIKIPKNVLEYLNPIFQSGMWVTGLMTIVTAIAGVAILTRIALVMQLSEYRIAIKNVLNSSDFYQNTYLPLLVNPAGGMPLMYSMTIMTLPQYIFQLLAVFWPDNQVILYLISNLTLSSALGITFYVFILFILTIGFAFVNVDPDQMSETLQQNGDYIVGVDPGVSTKNFLTKKIFSLATVGAVYLELFAGIPLYLGLIDESYTNIVMSTSMVLIVVGMTITVNDQVQALWSKNKYSALL